MKHRPVLLDEVIAHLAIEPNGIYVDATFGRGGHSTAILNHLGPAGRLLAIDKDPQAVSAASGLMNDPRFSMQAGSFVSLGENISQRGWEGRVNGILLDLGVSSPQIDEADRGFSFLRDGPLDMRMDTTQTMNAARWLNQASEQEIRQILKEYGEERFAKRIATAIAQARQLTPITTTLQLAEIVAQAHPRWEPNKHPATRTFQAIRIFINHELEELTAVLPQCLTALTIGGRLLVISFHSLEEQIIKAFLQIYANTAHVPRELPLTHAQLQSLRRLKRINGVIRPSESELQANPRARSAKLHTMEKLS